MIKLIIFFRGFAACLAVCGATFLAYKGLDGWGWLLFVALVLGYMEGSTNSKESANEN